MKHRLKNRMSPFLRGLQPSALMVALGCAGSLLALDGSAAPLPPLWFKGALVTDVFPPGATNTQLSVKADFLVTVSNEIWEIEVLYEGSANGNRTGQSCKRIPDGIRVRPLFESVTKGAYLPAEALPVEYPPPEKTQFLACWLGLVPTPQLPILDGRRIRRFLTLALRDHPKNEGTYSAAYLQPGGNFLSLLSITNNGVSFTASGEAKPYRRLFSSGFLDLSYELTQSTNLNGVLLPAEGVLRQFAPSPYATNAPDVYPRIETRFAVTAIGLLQDTQSPTLSQWPTKYVALDKRFGDLNRKVGINYMVTNDSWLPKTNADLRTLATIAKGVEVPSPRTRWLLLFVLLMAAPAITYLCARRFRATKRKNENYP